MQLNASALQRIRGRFIASIFQEPLIALHPAIRVGQQVENVLAAHQPASRRAVREKTLEVLRTVFAKDAERIADSYPHRLSGGQRARVLIAQSIVCRPSLVIADEPTASLDSLTQLEIVALFRSLGDQYKLSMILITHNPLPEDRAQTSNLRNQSKTSTPPCLRKMKTQPPVVRLVFSTARRVAIRRRLQFLSR